MYDTVTWADASHLRLTAVPRSTQIDYPEGTEFDSSDTNVYFVKAGHVQLRAADKQLQETQMQQTVAQAAVAVQTMGPTGPLSKVALWPICLLPLPVKLPVVHPR